MAGHQRPPERAGRNQPRPRCSGPRPGVVRSSGANDPIRLFRTPAASTQDEPVRTTSIGGTPCRTLLKSPAAPAPDARSSSSSPPLSPSPWSSRPGWRRTPPWRCERSGTWAACRPWWTAPAETTTARPRTSRRAAAASTASTVGARWPRCRTRPIWTRGQRPSSSPPAYASPPFPRSRTPSTSSARAWPRPPAATTRWRSTVARPAPRWLPAASRARTVCPARATARSIWPARAPRRSRASRRPPTSRWSPRARPARPTRRSAQSATPRRCTSVGKGDGTDVFDGVMDFVKIEIG